MAIGSNIKIQYGDKFFDVQYLPGETQDKFLDRVSREIINDENKISQNRILFKPLFNKKLNVTVLNMTTVRKK